MTALTPEQRQRLHDFFQNNAPRHDANALTDSVASAVERWRHKEEAKQKDHKKIAKALKQLDAALKQLDGVTTSEGQHLQQALMKVRQEAGHPAEKGSETQHSYFDVTGAEIVIYNAATMRTPNNEAALIWALQGVWMKHFKDQPGKWSEHPFFEMAAIAMAKNDSSTVYRCWERNSIGNKTSAK